MRLKVNNTICCNIKQNFKNLHLAYISPTYKVLPDNITMGMLENKRNKKIYYKLEYTIIKTYSSLNRKRKLQREFENYVITITHETEEYTALVKEVVRF